MNNGLDITTFVTQLKITIYGSMVLGAYILYVNII